MMQLYHDNVEEEDIPKTAYAPLFQTMIMKKNGVLFRWYLSKKEMV